MNKKVMSCVSGKKKKEISAKKKKKMQRCWQQLLAFCIQVLKQFLQTCDGQCKYANTIFSRQVFTNTYSRSCVINVL